MASISESISASKLPSEAASVLVVADDLTGATDSSVQFAHAGWTTALVLSDDDNDQQPPGTVNARVTDSRTLASADAQDRTQRAVLSGRHIATRVYLKIDSTMRGTVSSQIAGALAAWQSDHPQAFALVCPAYPAMGRTVVDGQLQVNGTAVHETAIGRDPVTPVTTSSMSDFLPGSIRVRVPHGGVFTRDSLVSSIRAARSTSSVITIDAVESADLDAIAEAIAEFGDDIVPVGSAGLAAALAGVWRSGLDFPAEAQGSSERVIVVASSLHTVTRDQVATLSELLSNEVAMWTPDLDSVFNDSARLAWLQALSSSSSDAPIVIVNAPEERTDSTEFVAALLADAAELLMHDTTPTSLLLLGGEGARAVLNRLGAVRLRIHSTIREGIPIGTIEGGSAHGTTVVTKAGGFGRPTDVTDIAEELLHNSLHNNNEGPAQ